MPTLIFHRLRRPRCPHPPLYFRPRTRSALPWQKGGAPLRAIYCANTMASASARRRPCTAGPLTPWIWVRVRGGSSYVLATDAWPDACRLALVRCEGVLRAAHHHVLPAGASEARERASRRRVLRARPRSFASRSPAGAQRYASSTATASRWSTIITTS
jgi:hypothetical protein